MKAQIKSKVIILAIGLITSLTYGLEFDPNTQLFEAIAAGDKTTVAEAIQLGANVNQSTAWGVTPLGWAIERGKIEVVPLLLDAGADANVLNRQGESPLDLAIKEYEDLALAQLLIQKNADINRQDEEDGSTLLMWAVENNKPAIVSFLLNNNANTNLEDNFGETALDIAKKYGYTTIISLLESAIRTRQKEVAKVLIEEKETLPTELGKEISEFEI